jgi:hypothetical protein
MTSPNRDSLKAIGESKKTTQRYFDANGKQDLE